MRCDPTAELKSPSPKRIAKGYCAELATLTGCAPESPSSSYYNAHLKTDPAAEATEKSVHAAAAHAPTRAAANSTKHASF